jgi:hypothetical protein
LLTDLKVEKRFQGSLAIEIAGDLVDNQELPRNPSATEFLSDVVVIWLTKALAAGVLGILSPHLLNLMVL